MPGKPGGGGPPNPGGRKPGGGIPGGIPIGGAPKGRGGAGPPRRLAIVRLENNRKQRRRFKHTRRHHAHASTCRHTATRTRQQLSDSIGQVSLIASNTDLIAYRGRRFIVRILHGRRSFNADAHYNLSANNHEAQCPLLLRWRGRRLALFGFGFFFDLTRRNSSQSTMTRFMCLSNASIWPTSARPSFSVTLSRQLTRAAILPPFAFGGAWTGET